MRKILYVVFILLLCFPSSAYAYIDPGTGSLILQALAAAVLGIGLFWRRLLNYVKKIFGAEKDQ